MEHGIAFQKAKTCSTPWERTSSQCPTCCMKSSLWSPWDRHLVIWSNCPGLAVNHSLSSFIVVQSWELTSEVGTCKCSDLDVELRSNLGMAGSENGIICHWKWFMDPKLLESWLIHHNPFIFHIRPFPPCGPFGAPQHSAAPAQELASKLGLHGQCTQRIIKHLGTKRCRLCCHQHLISC